MVNYSANTCDIITLYPLGVECIVTDAYSPFTTDGSISLFITGGTSPYNVTWSGGGSQLQTLTNLAPGEYTATVIDYFGDFTATTTCEVGFETFYIESFFDCNDPETYLYYTADLENQIPTGKTWTIASQTGCWVSEGLVLYTGQSYYQFTATTTSGPFDNCTECFPTTPEIENTETLCLNSKIYIITPTLPPVVTATNNQYQFYSGNTINGYPSWTSATRTIYYNTTALQWMVSGWTLSGQPVLQSNISPPIGIWTFNGASGTINVSQGLCEDNIVLNTSQSSATCANSNNGLIQVTSVVGGIPPYTYSLTNNPIDYQTSPFFLNLDIGTYTVYAKDIIGNIGSKLVNVAAQSSVANYQITLNFIPSTPQITQTLSYKQTTFDWQVSIQPPLPPNKTITFDIIHTTNISGGTYTTSSPILLHSSTTGQTGGGQYLTSGITNSFNSSTTTFCAGSTNFTNFNVTATTRTYSAKITGPGTVGGQIFKKITTNNSTVCPTKGVIRDSFSVINATIVNQNVCETLNIPANPITNTLDKEGLLTAPPNTGGGGGVGG
jgi:hypothetical protein